jgi:hypothetical protein
VCPRPRKKLTALCLRLTSERQQATTSWMLVYCVML